MRRIILLALFLAPTLFALSQANLKEAEIFYRQKNWEAARNAYHEITQQNPYKGQYWYRLGYAAVQTGQYEQAAAALEKAVPLLPFPGTAMYYSACANAQLNEPEKAIAWLRQAWKKGYTDVNYFNKELLLANIRKHPDYLKLTGQEIASFQSREAGWLYDINYLADLIEKNHIHFNLLVNQVQWKKDITTLRKNILQLSDADIILELTRLTASLNVGHTNLFAFFYTGFHRLPAELYLYKNGVYIKSIAPNYAELVGAKVLRIGEKNIEELIDKSFWYIGADNIMQKRQTSPKVLQLAEFLQKAGAVKTVEQLPITVELEGGKQQTVVLKTEPVQTPQHGFHVSSPNDWIHANDQTPLPLYLQHTNDFYWLSYLPQEKVLYIQCNALVEKQDESFEAFSKRLADSLAMNEVDALVLDLRLNGGGNGILGQYLVEQIIRSNSINQKGKFFTIVSRQTFSAAMDLSCLLERWTNVMFVGEPTGSRPNAYGETNRFKLPYSGLMGSYASRYFQGGFVSDDDRPWIAPDLVAEMSSEDFKNNYDPSWEAILKYLGKR